MINFQLSAESIKQRIEQAFTSVQFPGDENLPAAANASTEDEIQDFFNQAWQSWQDIPGDTIDCNYCSLPFFSPEGFRFVLPAYMT